MLELVREMIVEGWYKDPQEVKPEAHLLNDLGLDDYASYIIATAIAAKYGYMLAPNLHMEDFDNCDTVQDLVDIVQKQTDYGKVTPSEESKQAKSVMELSRVYTNIKNIQFREFY